MDAKRTVGGQVGEAHHKAKLTEADVLEIRRRRADGELTVSLAAAFGVCNQTITRISRGQAWTHVGGARTLRTCPDGEGVYQRWAHGESMASISKALDYHARGISRLIAAAGGKARRDSEILARYREGVSMGIVAGEFGVCRSSVYAALERALTDERGSTIARMGG